MIRHGCFYWWWESLVLAVSGVALVGSLYMSMGMALKAQ